MARTLASAWVSVSPTGFADFGKQARDGIKRVMRGVNATVPVDADTKPATTDLDKLKARLKDFSKTVAEARLGVDTKQAAADLAKMDVRLDKLGHKVSSPRITLEGIKAAEAELLGLDAQLDRLNKKTAGPAGPGGGSRLASVGAGLGSLAGAGGLFAAGASALAIASPLAAATTAMAAFAGVAIPTLKTTLTASSANAKAQATYNNSIAKAKQVYDQQLASAKTAQQRQAAAVQLAKAEAAAQLTLSQNTTKLTGGQQQLAGQVQALQKMWSQLEMSLAPVVVSVATLAVKIARDFMPLMGPLVTAGGKVITAFLQPLDRLISSVDFDVIIGAFTKFGVQVAKLAGPQLAALLKSLLQLFVNLMPAGVSILGTLLPLLVTFVSDLTPTITAIANVTAATLGWLNKNHLLIPAIAAVGAAVLISVVAIEGASAPMWAIVAAGAAVVVGITELVRHWGTVWGEIEKIAGDAWRWLWSNVFAPMNTFFTSTIPLMADIAKENLRIMWDKIEILFLQGFSFITGVMGKLPGPLGAPFRKAHADIQGTLASIEGDVNRAQQNINADWAKIHGKSVTLQMIASGQGGVKVFSQGLAAKEILLSKLAGGGYVRMGSGPTSDDVPALLSRGEVVVPAALVAGGAVDHLRGRLPGFAGGGIAGASGVDRQAAAMPGAVHAALTADTQALIAASLAAEIAAMKKAVLAQQASLFKAGNVSFKPGAGVGQWAGTVNQALKLAGLSTNLALDVLYQMQTESGGNPTAVNRTDSNWIAGHPSVGLMQVIAGTYATYGAKRMGYPAPVAYGVSENPLANIYAAVNYAAHNRGFGTGAGQIGSGHGYAAGGMVMDRGGILAPGLNWAWNATGRPEHLVPAGGGEIHIHLENRGVIGSQAETDNWLAGSVNRLARTGRLTQAVRRAGG
jgi:SLT domain-containing protein